MPTLVQQILKRGTPKEWTSQRLATSLVWAAKQIAYRRSQEQGKRVSKADVLTEASLAKDDRTRKELRALTQQHLKQAGDTATQPRS